MFIWTKVNLLSDLVFPQFIEAFRKQFLKPFGLDQDEPEATCKLTTWKTKKKKQLTLMGRHLSSRGMW